MNSEICQYLISQFEPILEQAKDQYYKLVFILGENWRERTWFVREIASQKQFTYIALGLQLSSSLLNLPPRDRPMVLADHVNTMMVNQPEQGIVFDQIEIIFDPSLHTDPLRLFQMYARSRLIIVSWPGVYNKNQLSYAELGYPEYYSQTVTGLLTYSLEVNE